MLRFPSLRLCFCISAFDIAAKLVALSKIHRLLKPAFSFKNLKKRPVTQCSLGLRWSAWTTKHIIHLVSYFNSIWIRQKSKYITQKLLKFSFNKKKSLKIDTSAASRKKPRVQPHTLHTFKGGPGNTFLQYATCSSLIFWLMWSRVELVFSRNSRSFQSPNALKCFWFFSCFSNAVEVWVQ